MKHFAKGLLSITLLLSAVVQADDINGRSFFLGANGNIAGGGLLERAGTAHRHDADRMYACFSTLSVNSQKRKLNKSKKSKT